MIARYTNEVTSFIFTSGVPTLELETITCPSVILDHGVPFGTELLLVLGRSQSWLSNSALYSLRVGPGMLCSGDRALKSKTVAALF
jgi:hypothetical protein